VETIFDHDWNLSTTDAQDLQVKLATKIQTKPINQEVKLVAGVDVAYTETEHCVAAVTILEVESLSVEETVVTTSTVSFPYTPGLFSFREIPAILLALQEVRLSPQLIVCDGHGTAHPRGFGLACHLGLLLDVPCIGCAKKPFIESTEPLNEKRGSYSEIFHNDKVIGNTLRTQDHIKPVYVSAGHLITQAEAVEWTLKLCTNYRLPETTRQADQAAKRAIKQLF